MKIILPHWNVCSFEMGMQRLCKSIAHKLLFLGREEMKAGCQAMEIQLM